MVRETGIGVSKPVSVLLSLSDSAVKQILVTLDERPGQSFIIEDLDEFHVLIRADEEQRVRRELEAEVRPHPGVVSSLVNELHATHSWRRIHIAWNPSPDPSSGHREQPFIPPSDSLHCRELVRGRIMSGVVPKG